MIFFSCLVHQPLQLNDVNPPEKPPRCSSGTLPRSRWHHPKSWSASAGVKRKHGKTKVRPGEAKWYLDSISSNSTTNDDETKSAPPIVQSNSKPGREFNINKFDFVLLILVCVFVENSDEISKICRKSNKLNFCN